MEGVLEFGKEVRLGFELIYRRFYAASCPLRCFMSRFFGSGFWGVNVLVIVVCLMNFFQLLRLLEELVHDVVHVLQGVQGGGVELLFKKK